MKKTVSRLLALALTAALVLTGCGGGTTTEEPADTSENTGTTESTETTEGETAESNEPGENEITDLVIPKTLPRELETFNWLYSQRAEDSENLTQLVDGLLESNPEGTLQPAIAEDWSTEDGGKTWTFKLREGVKWVDVNGNEKADVTARDFATGLEWILNFHKNDSANTSMPLEMIDGAEEYYEYTKTLSKEEAYALNAEDGSQFMETVGIEIPDDYTIIYTCITEKPYFDTLAVYQSLYPISQAMIDELGGPDATKAMNNENMWYNGPYTMTSYIQGNEKVFTKNPLYWDTDCTLFDTVTVKLVESNDVAFQLYENNEVDYVQLTESQLTTIARDPSHPLYDYLVPDVPSHFSYQMQFNYNKMNEDGTPDTNWNTAIANENFRKSWWYGLDLSEWWKRQNAIDPMSCENNAFTMKGLVYTSDGKDYTQMVEENLGLPEKNGETMVRLDADQFEQCKAQAIEELTAAGVTFPVTVDYYISASSQTALDSANVLAQTFSDTLGDDYVKLNIKTYVNAINTEVVTPKLQSFVINGWGADYGDPQNYLGQMTYGQDTAYYSMQYNNINDVEENENTKALLDAYKEFTTMVDAANAINDDLDARYTAYAEAEAYMLEHVFVLPCYYQVGWCLTRVDNDTKMQPMFGSVGDKMKNWGSNVNGYTSEEKGVAELVAAYSSEQQ